MSRKRTIDRIVLQLIVESPFPEPRDAARRDANYEQHALDVDKRLTADADICESLEWVTDYDDRCDHCGDTWCEDSTTYNGGCCDEDEKGNPAGCLLKQGNGTDCTLTSNHGGVCR